MIIETEHVCIEAVRQNGWAPAHIKDPLLKESVKGKMDE